jgi:hypothetical protein
MMRLYTVWGVVVLLALGWAQWRGAAFANSAPMKGATASGSSHGSGGGGIRTGGRGTGSISRHK